MPRPGQGASSILDLGCGTGRFAATLAQEGRWRICRVDPAGPMLDIARARPGGQAVNWVQGDSRTIELNQRFDLILLTGHAFQVFLTEPDRLAVLKTIARHLAPQGRFIFDSRNPLVEEWNQAASLRQFDHPIHRSILAWNDVSHDSQTGIVIYGTFYKIIADGRTFSAQSKIAFPSREQINVAIWAAGLRAETWLGDWHGTAWHAQAKEIIPFGSRS